MREILFKAKRIDNGEWVEGYYTECNGKTFIGINISIYSDIFEVFCTPVIRWFEVDPKTLCQFTGLCDKNGKKIFEGDKLYCEAQLDKAEMYVVFEKGQFRMVLCDKFKEYETGRGYYDINCFQKTVVGNIHDNPELLKEESE